MVSYKSKKERGINSWSYCSIINVCCWWVTCVNLCLMRVNKIWDFKLSYKKFRFLIIKHYWTLNYSVIFIVPKDYVILMILVVIYRNQFVAVLHLFRELQVLRSNKDELQSGFLNVKSSTQLPIFNIFTHTRW